MHIDDRSICEVFEAADIAISRIIFALKSESHTTTPKKMFDATRYILNQIDHHLLTNPNDASAECVAAASGLIALATLLHSAKPQPDPRLN